MVKKDVLDELSYALPEKERVKLLERINRNIRKNDVEDEAVKKEKQSHDRETFVAEELNNTGWFTRLIMMIRCKFSGKNMGDIVVDRRMKRLKKSISRRQPNITGFESRNLTPEFGEKVFDLYSKTFAFRDFYRKLWLEPGVFESSCVFIIRAEYEETKNNLEEFITNEELVEIYGQTGKKEDIFTEIEMRLNEYLLRIPELFLSVIKNTKTPMYNLKDLILFPYTAFFQKFSFTPNRSDGGKHFFKNASAMLCLDYLTQLYTAVMEGAVLDDHAVLNKYLVEFMRNIDETDPLPENDREELKKLIAAAKNFATTMPLLEIIQYFKKEPYLKINYMFERRNFKDIYRQILYSQLKDEINRIYPEIQQQYIEREIKRIFQGYSFKEFRNYRKYASIDHQKMGLPYFTHTKSLNLLYNYIVNFYQTQFADLVSLLERGILAQNRITRDRLLTYSVAIQELEDKIEASDKSLAPENEDGKLFHKLRMNLVTEPSQQRMYRSMVINKNREVKSLLEWGEDALRGLEKIFDEIVTTESNSIKIQLNKHYLIKGKSITLVSLLKQRSAHIKEIRRLIAQIVKMETS